MAFSVVARTALPTRRASDAQHGAVVAGDQWPRDTTGVGHSTGRPPMPGPVRATVITCASVAAVVCGLLALPTSAGAEVASSAEFKLPSSNGYHIKFEAQSAGSSLNTGRRGRSRQGETAIIGATVVHGNAYSTYMAPGRLRRNRIRGRLGVFGRLHVRFVARKRRTVAVSGCTGSMLKLTGIFVGVIRFRGEHRYTRLRAHSARGYVERPKHLRCHTSIKALRRDSPHGAELHAQTPRGLVQFTALSGGRRDEPLIVANLFDLRARVSIFRFALAPQGTFTFNADLSRADVAAQGPFDGSADFARPDSWAGDLTVSFPGAPDVPLTGPRFTVDLTRMIRRLTDGSTCSDLDSCSLTAPQQDERRSPGPGIR